MSLLFDVALIFISALVVPSPPVFDLLHVFVCRIHCRHMKNNRKGTRGKGGGWKVGGGRMSLLSESLKCHFDGREFH